MKAYRHSRVIAVAMMLVLIMTSASFAADDTNSSKYAHQVRYMSSWDNSKSGELTYYFLESYFTQDSTKYNSHLSTASMALAMAGSTSSDEYIKEALTGLGCDSYASQDYGSSSENSVGVAVAKKKLSNGTTLVPVVIRGAGYNNEWVQNFKAGSKGNAEGYEAPANKVEEFVNKQIANNKNVVIWITGYSRGGSIANLAAKKLSSEYGKENVYAYCFDAPMSANPADSSCKNIHIVKNTYDGITLVLPKYMGFGSNGTVDKKLGPSNEKAMLAKLKEISSDSSKFKSPSNFKWAQFKLNLNLSAKNLVNDAISMAMGGGSFYNIIVGEEATPTELWNELLARLKVAIPSRSAYADSGIQDGFVAAVRLVRSLTDSELNALKNSVADTGTLMSLVGNKTLLEALASVQMGVDPALSESEYANIANTLANTLFKGSFSSEQQADAKKALNALIKPLLIMLAEDYRMDTQVLGTLMQAGNLDILAQCHYLEVNMAWLMTEDSYYNGETPQDNAAVSVATTKISKLTAAKKAFTVKWTKKTSKLDGYQIQYSTSSSFKSGNKTVKITKKSTTSKTIKKLKANKKYYVRIRCFRKVNGEVVPGKWSSVKSITTKK